jgi:Tol biopolymer transport system component
MDKKIDAIRGPGLGWRHQRRRLIGFGAAAVALGAIGGCGGGGGGGSDSSNPPADGSGSGVPPGAFGGGQGRVALMTSRSDLTLLDLARREVLATFDAGLDTTDFGVTATADGTIALVTRPYLEYGVMVRIFNADLSPLHEFKVSYTFGFHESAAAISPGGEKIAVGLSVQLTSGDNGWAILVADVDGGNQSFIETGRLVSDLLTERANPVWLPDGRLLVQTDQGLLLCDVGLTAFTPAVAGPTLIPMNAISDVSGAKLVFDQATETSGAGSHVWSQDVASGVATQLISGGFEQYPGALSPDGEWLLFLDNRLVELNGVPISPDLRSNYVSALRVADLPKDVTDLDLTLRDANDDLLAADGGGLIAWF